MRKLSVTTIIILSIGLALVIVGAVLSSITFTGAFDPSVALAPVLREIGYVTAALSGVVLVALGVSGAIKADTAK